MFVHETAFVASLCVLYALESIIGLFFNLYIMIALYKERCKLNNKPRNQGNNFICAQKLIDLIVCATAIPFACAALIVEASDNFIVCFIKEGLVMFYTSGSSFCVLLISVDRYFAVVLPTKQLMTPIRIKLCRVAVPVVALIGLSLPFLSIFMGQYYSAQSQISDILPCRHVLWVFKPYYFYELYYVLIFIIAVITACACYSSVLRVVRRRMLVRTTTSTAVPPTSSSVGENDYNERFRKQEHKASRVAFLVVLSFLICWVPHMILTVVQYAYPQSITIDMVQAVCLAIAFLAPIVHPVIYTYKNRDLRNSENRHCGIFICFPLSIGENRVAPYTTKTFSKNEAADKNTSESKKINSDSNNINHDNLQTKTPEREI